MTRRDSGDSTTSDDAPRSPEVAGTAGELVDPPPEEKSQEQLRDFMEILSLLAPRKPHPPAGEGAAPARSRRWMLVACFLVTLGVWLFTIWPRRPMAEMPSPLLGAWVTSTPDYADRPFWIGKRQVGFRVGPKLGDINVYPVTRVTTRLVSDNATIYDIEYMVDGGTSQWTFRYSGSPQPKIVFVHQPEMIWTRVPNRHVPIR